MPGFEENIRLITSFINLFYFYLFMIEIDNKNLFIADLHIHSKYSRATSKNMDLENLEKYARIKGLDLLGTGDFTHPIWLKELKGNLIDKGNGIFETKTGFKFILTGEISFIYTDKIEKKGRRIHLLILVPNFESVDKINSWLDTKGRRDYDGRPIFKISCEDFVQKMSEIDKKIEVIPAHIWTPWFGVLGSKSGFNSLKQAFGNQIDNIHAIETGLSSDPEMNWQLSELNDKSIISFSDSHSFWPWRLGREATLFNSIKSYDEILRQIRENDFFGTIEVDPCYGKYHYDGHRLCGFSSNPKKTKELNNICPVCNKPLTIGVENRVEKLKNQDIGKNTKRKKSFKLLPLHDLIALAKSSSVATKKTWEIYNYIIEKFENEYNVLLSVPEKEILNFLHNEKTLAELIIKNRKREIKVKPGFDGEYGKAELDEVQKKLF
jgi:uncharacterized protein (TIGR00375 family)